MSSKKWLKICIGSILVLLMLLMAVVILLDPFFHYHGPLGNIEYHLMNETCQNNGIARHFDYSGVITGSSMTENFKTSEAEELFGGEFIKIPYAGERLKLICDSSRVCLESHEELSCIIQGIDEWLLQYDKDSIPYSESEYPWYLYDRNIFNDVKYLLNKDVLLDYCAGMCMDFIRGKEGSITSFDEYENWSDEFQYGPQYALKYCDKFTAPAEENVFTEEMRETVLANVRQNLTALPAEYPDTEFYYFFTPASAILWGNVWQEGNLNIRLEELRITIEELLKYPNIKIFSFDLCDGLTTNLSLYKDKYHYNQDINSWILQQMAAGENMLTQENYSEYLENLRAFYGDFPYNSLFSQIPAE